MSKILDGLLKLEVFIPATVNVLRGHCIKKSRLIDYGNNEGTSEAFEKSWLDSFAFSDDVKLLTNTPTVMRASTR